MRKIALGLIALLSACSRDGTSPSSSPSDPGDPGTLDGATGAIGLRLTLGSDTSISTVSYTLQTEQSVVRKGNINTQHGKGVQTQLGNVPAGTYTIALSAASDDGGVSCLGTSGTFTVQPGTVTTTQVPIVCAAAAFIDPDSGSGSIDVTADLSFCATLQSVSTVGPGVDAPPTNGSAVNADGVTPIVITATAGAPDITAVVYTWSVLSQTGGGVTLGPKTGDGTSTSTQTLTCNPSTQDGTAVIQVTATEIDDGGVDGEVETCPPDQSTMTLPVECSGVPQDGGAAGG
ncbi:MAG: hypothetical protein FWD17_09465 [Polyangiaceae bacterium]|nr:hypothetical protein [Polyangiaceae bacterium]